MLSRPPAIMFSFKKYPSYEPRNSCTGADQLLLRLSVFAFRKLSVSDQQEHTEEIRKKVAENVAVHQLPEESHEAFRMRTFTELLKQLPYTYKNLFLFKILKKFKQERQFGEIISSFKQLDAGDQQKVIESIIHLTTEKNLHFQGEADEDFRLRRFTQLSRDYTDHVYKCLVDGKYIISENHDILLAELQGRYADFFFGFSTIWFQGQSLDVQRRLIKQLDGDAVLGKRLRDESEEDFNLKSFTELFCEKAVEFRPQVYFLDAVEAKLLEQEKVLPHGRLLPPQDFEGATELLSSLSTFGFSLLPEEDQLNEIKEMSRLVGFGCVNNRRQHATETSEEGLRLKRFKELYNKLRVENRIEFFEQLTKIFFRERSFCEAILLFRRLGSLEQIQVIQNLYDKLIRSHPTWERVDIIVEKLKEESEEDFRLSRFKKMYMADPSPVWNNWFCHREARKLGRKATLQLHASENNLNIPEIQQSRYAELYMGLALIWFKARCANHPRNPVHVILSGELFEVNDASKRLPDESEEDFRLRRFEEAFEQLEFDSKERIVKYIKLTLFHDLGYKPLEIDTMFRIERERMGYV